MAPGLGMGRAQLSSSVLSVNADAQPSTDSSTCHTVKKTASLLQHSFLVKSELDMAGLSCTLILMSNTETYEIRSRKYNGTQWDTDCPEHGVKTSHKPESLSHALEIANHYNNERDFDGWHYMAFRVVDGDSMPLRTISQPTYVNP